VNVEGKGAVSGVNLGRLLQIRFGTELGLQAERFNTELCPGEGDWRIPPPRTCIRM